jgi:hypothetical protein
VFLEKRAEKAREFISRRSNSYDNNSTPT